jgi:transposase
MDTKIPQRRDFKGLEKRRMKAATLFGRGCIQADVARKLQVSRETVRRWYDSWEQEGREGMKAAGRAGRKPCLNKAQLRQFAQELTRGPQAHGYETQLWTLERMAQVVNKLFGVEFCPQHIWRLLGGLGWSCQKPERQARERNNRVIRQWTNERWPRLKKKSAN